MAAETSFDYYYGDESNQFSFYRIPRQLVTGDRFKRLSTDAKLLYGLLPSRPRTHLTPRLPVLPLPRAARVNPRSRLTCVSSSWLTLSPSPAPMSRTLLGRSTKT